MNHVIANEIQKVSLENELKKSYLDYAMSVIVGRALPDVRDGLKPVHRRVLFAMHELSNDWNKPYKKSARIVGDVIGKYHPHGETAIYDTIVRMAQSFSMRYLLIDGQGNFGSVDGDSAAAMRYTEVRMSRFAHALLVDIEKETVDLAPNYDETEEAPTVLPTRIPNLLVNGSTGIAVGMATNIPPHNLTEVINACIALIDDSTLSIDALMHYVPGPDFPTAAMIQGRAGIYEAYHTGRGRIVVRAKVDIEIDQKTAKECIIVHELPYQVNKARLIERIAELVKEKKITGIQALRDESDKQGMRVVIEVRKGEKAEIIRNHLLLYTQLQIVYGINMVALVNGQPKILTLKQLLEEFLNHRREVVTRRTVFDLRKAKERSHLLEGLMVALLNIDVIVQFIKSAQDAQEAKASLMARPWASSLSPQSTSTESYYLSALQVQAILEMRLTRLTNLERDKLFAEYQSLQQLITDLSNILDHTDQLMAVIREELVTIKAEFGDERRTEIVQDEDGDLLIEDLIPEEELVVTLSHAGYVKAQQLEVYQAQHRGGKGKLATTMREEDFVEYLIVANSHDTVLCFTNKGRVYWLKVYRIPLAQRVARGRPIVNLLPLVDGEQVNAFLSVRHYSPDRYVLMATSKGIVKKVSLTDFSRPRTAGILAIGLTEGDYLIGADMTNGTQELMLFTDTGKVVRCSETTIRCMGRQATGVRGVKLLPKQRVVSLVILREGDILTVTENGYGKRTVLNEYRMSGRGAQGVIAIQVNPRNGHVVGAIQVNPNDEVMLISNKGTLVRVPVSEISLVGRNTQGVRLINLNDQESLVSLERIAIMELNPSQQKGENAE